MKTLVINLKKSAERRERMQRMLGQYPSLEVEFIEAVDGKKLTPEERMRRFDTGGGIFAAWARCIPPRSAARSAINIAIIR